MQSDFIKPLGFSVSEPSIVTTASRSRRRDARRNSGMRVGNASWRMADNLPIRQLPNERRSLEIRADRELDQSGLLHELWHTPLLLSRRGRVRRGLPEDRIRVE